MKTLVKLALGLSLLTSVSAFAEEAQEVSALIRCQEGKFGAMNAVSQLTEVLNHSRNAVYGSSGIGAYPDGHVEDQLVFVRAPFTVSAPTFVQVGKKVWACVTVQKR